LKQQEFVGAQNGVFLTLTKEVIRQKKKRKELPIINTFSPENFITSSRIHQQEDSN